jgi:hypothetical protein
VAVVPSTAPEEEPEMNQDDLFPPDGHRHWIFTGTLRDQKGQAGLSS